MIRLWPLGRLGLNHFDEGIYALAGLWVFSPAGLAGIDPGLISYAPPGFPVLVGLSYLALGVSDGAAILVSIGCGSLTIPVAAWLAHRTFGCRAGAATAAFAALSGPHVAFSRMALTDVSFLLFWLAAIGQGQRFLERPKPARALVLGLAVGAAQLFKYNGWIAGLIVASSAAAWLLLHTAEWRARTSAAIWGWGLAAAVFAAIVYWPWFRFVDSHGGYPALLAHQRSYLGDLRSWPGHLSQQIAQAKLLSGGLAWLVVGGLAAISAMLLVEGGLGASRHWLRLIIEALGLLAIALLPAWLVPALWIAVLIIWKLKQATIAVVVLAVGWGCLLALTPFYHPYARLWLPLQAVNWLFMGAAFAQVRATLEVAARDARWTRHDPLFWFVVACGVGTAFQGLDPISPWHMKFPRVLQPSDSVRQAAQSLGSDLPKEVVRLRVFARPPLIFYTAMSGRVAIIRQPDLAHLIEKGDPNTWAVLDAALTRQENVSEQALDRSLADWLPFREYPTTLNLPTLLDIDPGAVQGKTPNMTAPIRLLRPRLLEDAR
jgi:4-amino-4-deoxy-L-arabinose transferase-like glycosyltransferase